MFPGKNSACAGFSSQASLVSITSFQPETDLDHPVFKMATAIGEDIKDG